MELATGSEMSSVLPTTMEVGPLFWRRGCRLPPLPLPKPDPLPPMPLEFPKPLLLPPSPLLLLLFPKRPPLLPLRF